MNLREMVDGYLDYCRYRKELDQNTLKAYRIDLSQFFEAVGCTEPGRSEVEGYVTHLHKKYRQKTIKRKIASLHAFYSYLEEMEIISEHPLRKIRVRFREDQVLPRIIPKEEIERLLNIMYKGLNVATGAGHDRILRDIAVTETLFATGARVCEISNITNDTIDIKTGIIRIRGKGRKERYLQIGDEKVICLLRRYHARFRKEIEGSGYFFVNKSGTRFREQSIRDMLKKYTKEAGIRRNITPHMFRHSLATYLIEEDVDVSCVQQILGHSSLRTTQIYLHVSTGKQAEVLRTRHPRRKMNIRDQI